MPWFCLLWLGSAWAADWSVGATVGALVSPEGAGVALAVPARIELNPTVALRAGPRVDYLQRNTVIESGNDSDSYPGSSASLGALVGVEAALLSNDSVRPYLFGEVGAGSAVVWPRFKSLQDEVDVVAPRVSERASSGSGAEIRYWAVAPMVSLGVGLAVLDGAARVEIGYTGSMVASSTWQRALTEATAPSAPRSAISLGIGATFGP